MISQATTKADVARVLLKPGLRARVQDAVLAYEWGVLMVGQDNRGCRHHRAQRPVETSQS